MRVFLSWSGERSRILASLLADFLPRLMHPIRPWMSTDCIEKGKRWLVELNETLELQSLGIICVTPENVDSPWLVYETGTLAKSLDSARVCPLLLGIDKSDLRGPLSQFQATELTPDDVFQLILVLNRDLGDVRTDERILEEEFSAKWPIFVARLEEKLKEVHLPATEGVVPQVIKALSRNGFPQPSIGGTAHFLTGFESHSLYHAITEAANHRLYIYGRKNRKLFDKEHRQFIDSLASRIENGLDFRCLFLDPDGPDLVLDAAHEDAQFRRQLRDCIENALGTLRNAGVDVEKAVRLYRCSRGTATAVVDDAVLFSPIELGPTGKARSLTQCGFSITGSDTPDGEHLVRNILAAWEGGLAPKS